MYKIPVNAITLNKRTWTSGIHFPRFIFYFQMTLKEEIITAEKTQKLEIRRYTNTKTSRFFRFISKDISLAPSQIINPEYRLRCWPEA